ncbi:cytochrome P450 [Amylostereum chailletii]|nr:cytochrome P450 [Amylostereum chailletii]
MILLAAQGLTCIYLVILVSFLIKRAARFWALRNIPGPSNASFVAGNMLQMSSINSGPFHQHIMDTYGRVVKLHGFLGDTLLVISDPKALSLILTKEQYVFEETSFFVEGNRLIFGTSLFSTLGTHHRKQRKLLNPVFSIAHMRRLIPIFQSLTLQLQGILRKQVSDGPHEIDMVDWMGRLALEVMAQAGLGHTFNTFDSHKHEYCRAVEEFVPTFSQLMKFGALFPSGLVKATPKRVLSRFAKMLPWGTLHHMMGIVDTMHVESKGVWERKKALFLEGDNALVNQVGEGRDIMSILLKENFLAPEEDRLPDNELLAQLNALVFAGSDTTSNALARILHLLAQHPEAQEKLRAELRKVESEKGQLEYDDLVGLPYLDAVCRESLRLYPPIHFQNRISRKDMVVSLDKPIKSNNGEDLHELFVPNGTTIMINILGVNCDPSIWGPDALEWKPERWLSHLPESVTDAKIPGVYANTLTFLGGGRACIGFRFSRLEMKVVLAQLLATFKFELSKKEIFWKFGGFITPSVKGSTAVHPSLPMNVSLA